MKPIIVCTDFSPGSKNATRYAAKLSSALKADLILVHIDHHPGGSALSKQQDIELNAKLILAGDELMKGTKLRVKTEKRKGLPVNEIIAVAKKHSASLIITGSKETPAGSGLVGGLVYDLMHAAQFPVLAVPAGCPFSSFKKIVLALDPKSKTGFDDSALKNFIGAFGSELIITAVAEPGTKEKALKDASAASVELRYAELLHRLCVVENASLEKGIDSVIKQNEAELLVIVPHHNHYIDRMLKITKTQKVLKNIRVPMLALPK